MGIVNVTPDSFSDGGDFYDHEAAIAHGCRLLVEGADLLDIGGESTRPGAAPVDADEERRRVIPVVEALAERATVSIDTTKPEVARAALEAGATIVNDVSASLGDVAAELGAGWIAMHMQGDPRTMQTDPSYDDIVRDVLDFLVARADAASDAGISQVWIDPGIGFGKTRDHNLSLLKHLDQFVASGFPVAVGTSRKSFLGSLLADSDSRVLAGQVEVHTGDRHEGSLATATWAMTQGVDVVRTHDVLPTVQAATLVGDRDEVVAQ